MAQSERHSREDSHARTSGRRAELTLPLSRILSRLAQRWGKEDDYCMWELRRRWAEVVPDAWAQNVRPVGVDEEGRLVVSVPHAASLKMELQRKGTRWRALLDGVCAVSGRAFTDLIVQDSRRRPRHGRKG